MPEAIEQMKAELAEIGGTDLVQYLDGQTDEIAGENSYGSAPDHRSSYSKRR